MYSPGNNRVSMIAFPSSTFDMMVLPFNLNSTNPVALESTSAITVTLYSSNLMSRVKVVFFLM